MLAALPAHEEIRRQSAGGLTADSAGPTTTSYQWPTEGSALGPPSFLGLVVG
jgi:hypothetical protein